MNNSISQFSSYQLNPTDPNLKDLYSKLIIWMMFIRDTTTELSELRNLNELSYEWLRILKYKCDVIANKESKENETISS